MTLFNSMIECLSSDNGATILREKALDQGEPLDALRAIQYSYASIGFPQNATSK